MISTDDPLCSTIAAPHLVMMSAEALQQIHTSKHAQGSV